MPNLKKHNIVIKGNPVPQKRHKFARGFSYDPSSKDKKTTKLQIKSQYKNKSIHEGPVSIFINFYMQRPKNHYRTGKFNNMLKANKELHHIKRPDIDNLLKFILDCMNGIVYKDDSQVFCCTAQKLYGEEPQTTIDINLFRRRNVK
jgi:Holliday junction resolvase RusA-like endonuclease